jgi:hypothetical protein
LNIAETVLRTALKSKYPKEQAEAQLKTFASLANKEAPGNPYSAHLSNVLELLEGGATPEEALRQVQASLRQG